MNRIGVRSVTVMRAPVSYGPHRHTSSSSTARCANRGVR